MTVKWQNSKGEWTSLQVTYKRLLIKKKNTDYCDDSAQILKDFLVNDQSSERE